ncbi:hypothetical protein [Actinosynnema sp. ALI-1.44]|uniref:hypothetical protein n=1 Tax=Actinosynnema sp. ALI-1.44 TaxID=1933779 RepID=UPI00097BD262|nr:hypothetical protein [Actinosynnema sp. ALI-1.44]
MNLEPDGSTRFSPTRRGDVPTPGAAMLTFGLDQSRAFVAASQETTVAAFEASFRQHRQFGQIMSPAVVLPALIAQTHTLRGIAGVARPPMRARFLRLASRYAEYVGWMTQEAGNDRAAMWWTDTAVDMAIAAGDVDLAAHSRVRHALIALYQEDATQTIGLAHRTQTDTKAPARIRGMAALREAQGHALAGDERRCRATLDHAEQLLDAASADGTDGMALGTTAVSAIGPMVTGWCLYDLGRPAQAAETLDQEMARLPGTARRARARFGARQALAHAAAGEIDHACALSGDVLDIAELVDSATIRYDLRRLARTLGRWQSHRMVRELQPRLTMALHAPVC